MTEDERLAIERFKLTSRGDPLPEIEALWAKQRRVQQPAGESRPQDALAALARVRGALQRLRREGCISGRDERLIAAWVDQAVDTTVKVEWDEPEGGA